MDPDPQSFYLPDPDPHSEKLLDPDPLNMNADPQPCYIDNTIVYMSIVTIDMYGHMM